MPTLDSFESVFKSAAKARFQPSSIHVGRVMVVTSLEGAAAQAYLDRIKACLGGVLNVEEIDWRPHDRGSYQSASHLLEIIEEVSPDLVCTYRNLYTPGKVFPFSLGTYLDVLTQEIDTPVLVTPRPNLGGVLSSPMPPFKDTLVITDHLTGADALVSWGVRFTSAEGKLVLAHMEDDAIFERYMDAISKIPTIDTPRAREALQKQLLKEPTDYIQSCRDVLDSPGSSISSVVAAVQMGHRVEDFRAIIAGHSVELVVFNTKDDDQLAMHGLAFPLAVELRDVPLLML